MAGMRVNLAFLLRQAAATIPPRKDVGAYAFSLREVAGHIDQVRAGTATLDEFADLYLISPPVDQSQARAGAKS